MRTTFKPFQFSTNLMILPSYRVLVVSGGFHLGQISFLFMGVIWHITVYTVNLRRWKFSVVHEVSYVPQHVPLLPMFWAGALAQNRYTYRHNLALQCLAIGIPIYWHLLKYIQLIQVFANLPNLQARVSPPATVPLAVMVIVFHNTATNSFGLFKLTDPSIGCRI